MPQSRAQRLSHALAAVDPLGHSISGAERYVRWGTGIACVLLLSTATLAVWSLNESQKSVQLVNHTHEVVHETDAVLASLADAETTERTFQLIGRDDPQPALATARKTVREQIAKLKSLTEDNPSQAPRIASLTQMVERRFDLSVGMIAARRTAPDSDIATLAENVAKANELGNGIRSLARQINLEEQRLLEERTQTYHDEAERTKLWLIVGKGGALVLLLSAFWLLQRELIRRAKSDDDNQRAMQEIEDLYNRAPCGYHSVDANGVIIRINDTQLQWLGYRREEVVGKLRHPDLMTPASAARFHAEVFPLFLRQGWLKEVEFDYLRKDGTIMPGLLNATAVYDEFGRYQWSRTTLYDISDRRTIEERLHTLHRELDIHAQQLKAANEELESFAYSISHDLRAPLRAIDGYARMLDDDYGPALDDEGRRRIGIIRSSGRRMSDLIDDLLAFSHVGRREKFLEDADMNAIVNDAWSEVCASSEGTPPALSVGALPRATVDRAMFKQVWVNLLSNAWKYSAKKDHPIIRISGHASATGLEYRIEDNGAGFDMRYYDKLFGVFQRLHTEREFPGTGVGLAIVQRVLKQHGGQARGESRLGEGATFYLTLPRKVHDR